MTHTLEGREAAHAAAPSAMRPSSGAHGAVGHRRVRIAGIGPLSAACRPILDGSDAPAPYGPASVCVTAPALLGVGLIRAHRAVWILSNMKTLLETGQPMPQGYSI